MLDANECDKPEKSDTFVIETGYTWKGIYRRPYSKDCKSYAYYNKRIKFHCTDSMEMLYIKKSDKSKIDKKYHCYRKRLPEAFFEHTEEIG